MNISPIKTEENYKAALSLVESLSDAQVGTEEFDRLDIIVTLIEAYEAKHHPIGPPDPIATIEYEMEKRGLTRRDLEKIIGPSGRVSEVLNRQRSLTVTMMRRLQSAYQISPSILIASYSLDGTKQKSRSAARKAGQQSHSDRTLVEPTFGSSLQEAKSKYRGKIR